MDLVWRPPLRPNCARPRRPRWPPAPSKSAPWPLEQQPIFSKSAAARQGARCALLACRVPVELLKAKSPKRNPQCLEVSCKTRSRCRASWSRVQWRGLLGHRWASELSVHPSSSAQTLRHLAFTSSSRKRAAIAPCCASRALRRRDVPHRRLAPHHAVWWLAVSQRRGAPRPTRSQPAQQPHSCRAWPPQLPALPQLRAPW